MVGRTNANSNLVTGKNICFGFCESQNSAFSFTTVDVDNNVTCGLNIENDEFINEVTTPNLYVKSKNGGTYIVTKNFKNETYSQEEVSVSANGVIYSYLGTRYAETYCIIKK